MDVVQNFLQTHMSPTLLSTLSTHSSTYYRILTAVLSARSLVVRTLDPFVNRLIHSPDLPTVVITVLVLFISYQFVTLAYRTLVFWLRMIFQLVVWVSLAVAIFWVYTRGMSGMTEDVGWISREFSKEYDGWQKRTEMARLGRQAGAGRWN